MTSTWAPSVPWPRYQFNESVRGEPADSAGARRHSAGEAAGGLQGDVEDIVRQGCPSLELSVWAPPNQRPAATTKAPKRP